MHHYRLEQRSNGYWYVDVTIHGTRHRPSCKTKSHREAKQIAPAIVEAIGELSPSGAIGSVTLAAALRAVAEGKRNARTAKMYVDKARTVLRSLPGDSSLLELQREDVDRYVAIRRQSVSDHTIQKEITLIRQAWLTYYPALACPVPRFSSHYEPRKRWLSLEQAAKLLRACGRSERRTWLMLALYAGAEPAAIKRTRWEDVHRDEGMLHVRGTKGETRDRMVPLSAELVEYLAGLDPSRPLVPNWANPHRDMKVWCARAGIDPCTRTDLRRTFGSWLKQSGVDSKRISDLMGHVNTLMVDRVYAQLNRAAYQEAIDLLPRLPKVVAL